MSRTDIGNNEPTLQAGAKLVERDDGLIEGSASFVGERSLVLGHAPLGSGHPLDSGVGCNRREITLLVAGKAQVTCSYMAVGATRRIATYTGGSGQQAIQTHPDFINFAGDPTAAEGELGFCEPVPTADGSPSLYVQGANGSRFDAVSGEFVGFLKPNSIKAGLTAWVKAGDQVAVTYWSDTAPDFTQRNQIFTTIPGVSASNPEVVNWLLIDMPAQEHLVGNDVIFRVTELYLGSDEYEGWDEDLYGSSFVARDTTRLEPSEGLEGGGSL